MEALLPPHSKYGYNAFEQLFMLVITGITNFGGIPACFVLFKTKRIFEAYLAAFTVFTSFMYHSLESIDMKSLFLDEGQWHRLDNIGAITCFMVLFVHLMDNENPKLDFNLGMCAFLIAIFAQEKDPWNLTYTLVPIFLYIGIFIVVTRLRQRKAHYNPSMIKRALIWLFIGAINFSYGLDEFKDHLRFFHGMWHLCVGISSFYFWQIKVHPGEEFSFRDFWTKEFHPRMLLENRAL
jgi:predicted membrane channel-forming protein YqfA (hemolysin III family)